MIKNQSKKLEFNKYIVILCILSIILMLIIMPSIAMQSFFTGILIWATKVLPSLLPFFILTKLLSYTTFISTIGKKLNPITKKLYGVGGVSGYIFTMSIVSGYPMGAKLTSDMYSNKIITTRQASVITSFTSTSGPLFIIGSVAIGMYNNPTLGYIILISHYLSALINGLIYRKEVKNEISTLNSTTTTNPLGDSMTNSIASIMTVGGFIALFYMILSLLLSINAFTFITFPLELIGISKDITSGIISGLIEVTTGCIMISKLNLSLPFIGTILSFLISFGGLSIHAQAYCFLKSFNMPYFKFLLQKTTHAIISSIITLIILII